MSGALTKRAYLNISLVEKTGTQKGQKNCAGKTSGRGNGQIMTKAKDRFQARSYVLTSLTSSTFGIF